MWTAIKIFRFVQGRDSLYRKHHCLTDEADPQWKKILKNLGVHITYPSPPRPKERLRGLMNGCRTG